MKLFSRHAFAGVTLALLVAGLGMTPSAQAADPALPKKILSVEGITEYRLDNGLRVLLYPDPSSSRVTVNMTVFVGSRHEGYGETGMAHLLEHMVFKGTPKHPDVPKALRDHGGQFNGTTWVDRTNYFESMPATEDNLEFAIRLEADRLVNSFIKREDLLSEMTVVRNEFEQGENSPEAILSQRMMAIAYEWHNYGKSTIGNRSDIERVPIESLQAFYRKYYQPDNAMLIVAGKFDEAKALQLIAKYCGPLKKPARQLSNTYTEEPAQDGEREVILRRVGKVGCVGAIYHLPAAAHEDFAACEVLNQLLVSEPSGRLYKAIVESKKGTQVSGVTYGWHDPGVLEIQINLDKGDEASLQAARDAMIDTLEKLHKTEFTKEEVERARQKLLKSRELLMNDANRIGITLSEWASKGDWRLFFLHRDRLEKVTVDDVKRVVGRYLQRSNRTVGMYVPSDKVQRTPVPETPKIASVLKDYKGRAAVSAGEAFDPTPENIEKRLKRGELPSGVKTALLPKKTRAEAVTGRLALHFGNAEAMKGKVAALEFLGPLLRMGTTDMTRQQIQDELDKLKASLSVNSDAGELTVSITCKRETLPAVLTLLGKILRHPSFPENEFEILRRQTLEGLEKELTEPTSLAQRALRRKIDPQAKDHVRYIPTVEEEIERVKALTIGQIRAVYKDLLGGTEGEFVLVGDFDPDAASKQMGEILKDWKSAVKYERVVRKPQLEVKGERISINTPDKANAIYVAAHTMAMQDNDPDYPAMQIGNFLLGAAPLSSRLSNRVRGKEGLSYGVGSQVSASARDRYGVFLMFAICNPENIEKVDKAIDEELVKALKEGVTEKEVSEAKKAYLQRLKVGRGTDSALASQLATNLNAGRTFAYQAAQEKAITELTTEAVNAALRKHLEPKRLVLIRAGDFKKKAESQN